MDEQHFNNFVAPGDTFPVRLANTKNVLIFENTNQEAFIILEDDVKLFLSYWLDNVADIEVYLAALPTYQGPTAWHYREEPYRSLFRDSHFFADPRFRRIRQLGRSQTRGLLTALSKYVGAHIGNHVCTSNDPLLLDSHSLTGFFHAL